MPKPRKGPGYLPGATADPNKSRQKARNTANGRLTANLRKAGITDKWAAQDVVDGVEVAFLSTGNQRLFDILAAIDKPAAVTLTKLRAEFQTEFPPAGAK